MKKSINLLLFLILIGLLIYFLYPNITDIITKPSAREKYERNFSSETIQFKKWKKIYENSLQDSLIINLPFTESGIFETTRNEIYSFNFNAKEGQLFVAEVISPIDSISVFIELFKIEDDSISSLKLIKSNQPQILSISEIITENSNYKIIVQPEIMLDANFSLKIYSQPSYHFPVVGAGNKNIQSFWGASREGGRRSHKGNDIFAPRGTPVIAVTDGIISSTGNRGLGGKQVWLRDKLFGGNNLYYAHLDSIIAIVGQRVKIGDTLGLVGNTGNAKNTPTHLHFGIYQGRKGAIDPLPFIKISEIPDAENELNISKGIIKNQTVQLKITPDTKAQSAATLNQNDSINILGKSGEWYHIVTKNLIRGFVLSSQIEK